MTFRTLQFPPAQSIFFKRQTMTRIVLAALLGCTLTACEPTAPQNTAVAEPMLLRTYQVPAGDAYALRSSLDSLFRVKNEQVIPARVEVLPDQQLAVYASESTHLSVAQVLAQLKPAVPSAQAQVKVNYWLVLATVNPANLAKTDSVTKTDSTATTQSPAVATPLGQIQAALTQIQQQHGAMQFELLERLELTSLQQPKHRAALEDDAMMEGRLFQVQQEFLTQDAGAQLQLKIAKNSRFPAVLSNKLPGDFMLKTTLKIDQPEQLLVIGANASNIETGQYLYTIVQTTQQ